MEKEEWKRLFEPTTARVEFLTYAAGILGMQDSLNLTGSARNSGKGGQKRQESP